MTHPRHSERHWIVIGIVALAVGNGAQPTALSAQDETLEAVLTLTHQSAVKGVCFSPDGTRIASGGNDRVVRVWNASDGKQLFVLKGHSHSVNAVRFSPDGKRIASGSSDRTVRIWDAATGQQLQSLLANLSDVRDIAFSPDGMHIASVGVDDRTVNVWNTSSGEIAFSLTGPSEWQYINSVEFSPDGKWLATGSYDGTIQLCDASTGRESRVIATRMGNIRGLSFSPDSKQLAAAGSDVTVWGVEMGQQTGKFKVPGMLFDVAFSPSGKRIAACTHEAHVAEWDIATGRETLSHAVRHDRPTFSLIDNHINYVHNVAYRPDGTQLAACSSDGEVRVWKVSRD